MSDNPYQPPEHESNVTLSGSTLMYAVATVFGSAIVGGLLGLVIGAALGSLMPNYYRSIFANGNEPWFDPLAVGIGQGLTQGFVGGGVAGLAVVAIFLWYRSRARRTTG